MIGCARVPNRDLNRINKSIVDHRGVGVYKPSRVSDLMNLRCVGIDR